MKYIGRKVEGKEYKERRTAYALITDADGNIAIILERGNMYNMIGGKIEDGEETKETLIREAREKIGYELENVEYLESLACYHYLDFLDKYELAIMDFYSADIGEKVCEPIERDVKLVYLRPEDAVNKMYFEYHRYFLEKYLENNKEIER